MYFYTRTYVWVCSCVWVFEWVRTRSHPWTFQFSSPERKAAPFAPLELQSALSVTHCTHGLWLAGFYTPGKGRMERGWPLTSGDQPFFSRSIPLDAHSQCVVFWMLKHGHEVRVVRTGNTFPVFRQIKSSPSRSVFLRDAFRPPAPRPFVDDIATCDSSEANRAWSSLPAENFTLLVSYRWTQMRQGPSCSTQTAKSNFIFCQKRLWVEAVQIQNHGQCSWKQAGRAKLQL